MNALVGYGSSDEEEKDIAPEKPSKIAKTETNNNATGPTPNTTTTTTPPPPSPYTTERQRIHSLTMPQHPNFEIPASPPPTSDAASNLAQTTKKFNRFLALKQQGIHFNARLEATPSLRNPSLLPQLMDFAGIEREGSYASTLGEEAGGVAGKWDEEFYVENLIRVNEKRRREEEVKGRGRVEFVAEVKKSTSASATPGERRKSRFDEK